MWRRRTASIMLIRKSTLLLILISTLSLYFIITYYHLAHIFSNIFTNLLFTEENYKNRYTFCHNINEMLVGKWLERNLTRDEDYEINLFLETARSQYHIPYSLDRPDGRCGSLLLNDTDGPILFRALCDPKGDNPCCMDGMCVSKSEVQCRCENCYDLRHRIHAEYSEWMPLNPKCRPHNFTSKAACRLMAGGDLIFLGDSSIRHLYMAILLLLKNDPLYGALFKGATQDIRYNCIGLYMFSQRQCRFWMARKASPCNQNVSLTFIGVGRYSFASNFLELRKTLAGKDRSLIITGIGINDNYKYRAISEVLRPVVRNLRESNEKWPKVIWASAHAPGLLKTPTNPFHRYSNILKYNEAMNTLMRSLKVPVFDTFDLSDGVVSFDGTHYGLGLNLMKAQILLNYVADMERSGNW